MPATETGHLGNDDFEELYAAHSAETPTVAWDLGAPQPVVVALADAGAFSGEVADLGCGFGENAIYLASRGQRVTGLDGAPTAIARARATAAERGVDVAFAVADALKLDGYEGAFDTVLDSALYHCLTEQGRHLYAAALARAVRPGARLHLLCFSTELRGLFPVGYLAARLHGGQGSAAGKAARRARQRGGQTLNTPC